MKTLAGISLVLSVVTAGCGSGTNGTDAKRAHGPDESALISDQGHNDGIAGFFFLSPTVSQAPTSFTGLFDPSAAATARVCAGTGPCTDKSAMAVFTRGGGTGGGPLAKINVNTTLQRYTAVWDTKQCATGGCALTPGAAYRRHVSAVNMANTEVELGFADLQVVAKPPAPPVVTSGFSLLVKDLPYTIAFRIEKCATAVCAATDQCHVAGTCVPNTGLCSAPTAKPNGASCDDGNACTRADSCTSGVCTGTSVTCM